MILGDEHNSLSHYFYTSFLACYLIENDLNGAKYLWKRAPVQLKATESRSMLREMWEVGKSMWADDVTAALNALSINWPVELVLLITELKQSLIKFHLDLIAKTYQQVAITRLSDELRLSPVEVVQSMIQIIYLYFAYSLFITGFVCYRIPVLCCFSLYFFHLLSVIAGAKALSWTVDESAGLLNTVKPSVNVIDVEGGDVNQSKSLFLCYFVMR